MDDHGQPKQGYGSAEERLRQQNPHHMPEGGHPPAGRNSGRHTERTTTSGQSPVSDERDLQRDESDDDSQATPGEQHVRARSKGRGAGPGS